MIRALAGFLLGLSLGLLAAWVVELVSRRLAKRGGQARLLAGSLLHILTDILLFLLLFRLPPVLLGCALGLLLHIAARVLKAYRAPRGIGGETNHG